MRITGIFVPYLVLLCTAFTTCASSSWSPTAGVQVTFPQKLSVSVGISSVPWGRVWSSDGGVLLRLEPGFSGGKLHLGVRNALSMVFLPIVSADICASVMYTWNDPWSGLLNDQTYVGAEFRATAVPVIISFGIYRHVAGGDTEHDWVFSAGGGLGF
jgi:hypothetical protein